jgi:hypothetical protein
MDRYPLSAAKGQSLPLITEQQKLTCAGRSIGHNRIEQAKTSRNWTASFRHPTHSGTADAVTSVKGWHKYSPAAQCVSIEIKLT